MYKTFALALLVSTLVTACGATVPGEAPVRERTVGHSGAGASRQVLPADKYRTGTYLGKSDAAKHGVTGVKRPDGATGGAAPGASGYTASEAGGETPSTLTTPSHLALVKDAPDMKIAAVLSTTGTVDRLLFSPASGTLTWTVKATGGTAPVPVKTVKLTLQALASYPEAPEGEASGAMPSAQLDTEPGEPVSVELDTAALGWQGALQPDAHTNLALKLDSPAIRDFLAEANGVAKLSVQLDFLKADGTTIPDAAGKPFQLKTIAQVL